MKSTILTLSNYLMTVVFLFCVAVQYNDPDPIRWMTIYGLACLACVLYLSDRLKWTVCAGIGVIAFVWAISIIPHILGKPTPWNEVFGTMRMITEAVEETREMGGLLIVSFWMLVLTVSVRKS